MAGGSSVGPSRMWFYGVGYGRMVEKSSVGWGWMSRTG